MKTNIYSYIASLLAVSIIIVPMLTDNLYIKLISLILLTISFTIILFVIQKSVDFDKRFKKLSWILVLPILSFLSTILKLIKEAI